MVDNTVPCVSTMDSTYLCRLRIRLHVRMQAFVPRRFSQLSDATWDIGVLLLSEAVGLELGWLSVADLTGPQVLGHGSPPANTMGPVAMQCRSGRAIGLR